MTDPNRQMAEFVAKVNGWPSVPMGSYQEHYDHITHQFFYIIGEAIFLTDKGLGVQGGDIWQPMTDANQLRVVKAALDKNGNRLIIRTNDKCEKECVLTNKEGNPIHNEDRGYFIGTCEFHPTEEEAIAECVKQIMEQE